MRVFDDMIVEFCSRFQTREQCVRFVGYIAVYRFCIPLAIFHFLLMLFTVTNTDSQSWRGKLHNGFWLWKCVFIIGLWIVSIFISALEKATIGKMFIIIINIKYGSLDVAGRSGGNCFHFPTNT
nr:serine incorporator 5 [Hymenolepis microstoma]